MKTYIITFDVKDKTRLANLKGILKSFVLFMKKTNTGENPLHIIRRGRVGSVDLYKVKEDDKNIIPEG